MVKEHFVFQEATVPWVEVGEGREGNRRQNIQSLMDHGKLGDFLLWRMGAMGGFQTREGHT